MSSQSRFRRTVLALALIVGLAGVGAPQAARAGHDASTCSVSNTYLRPSTVLDQEQPITYGASASCTNQKKSLKIDVLLQARNSFGGYSTLDSVSVTRSNSYGFSVSDTYDPGSICGILGGVDSNRFRVYSFIYWTNYSGDTNAKSLLTYHDLVCSPGIE